jgi:FKBP-type peptidyl-prolyl cis-trans isomerase SlyD
MKIAKNRVVSIDYTLTEVGGEVLDTSKGREPLSYLHGNGNIIPGLESSLEGKSAGEHLNVTIPPADAYGELDAEKMMDLPREQFAGIAEISIGMQFSARSDRGEQIVTVTSVQDDTITVDANHPLAGKTLNFDVTIVGVREATKEELDHGHVHGPGGHH